MKRTIVLAILLLLIGVIGGCAKVPEEPVSAITGTQQLLLTEQEVEQLGLSNEINADDLEVLGLANGTNCHTEEGYSNVVDSTMGQYSICAYNVPALNDTQIIIQLTRYENTEARNGSYMYESSHYYSAQGLISENDYGELSRFRMSNENDYGGEYNVPGEYYYHLWICKELYLIHITSGKSLEAKGYIEDIAQVILSRFG